MILESVPYFALSQQSHSAAGTCLAMVLAHHGETIDPDETQSLYQHIFSSSSFYNWYIERHNLAEDVNHVVYACLQYLIGTFFSEYDAAIVTTSVDRIKYSYIKRQIPVILHGKFPYGVSSVPHTVVVRGYVDNYLVINDPRGNARSGYVDRCGELMLYSEADMARYCAAADRQVAFLRIVRRYDHVSGI